MKHEEYEVYVVVDECPLEEFNVDKKYDAASNTWTYTGEIAYTHNKNFEFQMLYTAQKQGHGVVYHAHVDGQAADELLAIAQFDRWKRIEGFRQSGSIRPFRWTRLARRQDTPVSPDPETPSDVGTLSVLLEPLSAIASPQASRSPCIRTSRSTPLVAAPPPKPSNLLL
ncbi:hypothetical protein CBOM_03117 [Ceraceosorus bombacis]|uniref:Uncharacterized protein n=1 Tax=Ceraceosorus bombacis TaxID=401625 RepID=A0A0P1BKJ7_9BASI|nr:hypothetical protein CBOM_03117 [Ceraceosorus bombacis]